jgi:hypothetical protein
VIHIERQSEAAGRNADAGDITLLDGHDGFVYGKLGLEVQTGMKMVVAEFTEVGAESGRNGDGISVLL